MINCTHADRGVVEVFEWDEGTDVDKCRTIEQQVNDVRECGILGSLVEESIPCES